MSRLPYEGRTNVYWATTVASKNAPTVAEITAAVNVTNFVPKDGVAPNLTTNNVDSATIAEIFDAQVVGSYGANVQITGFRDDTADTFYDLCVYGTNGFLILDRFNPSGTLPSAGDKVEVWPAQMHEPVNQNSATNTQQRFIETFAITSAPALRATVAA
jgi:hypothetical protein